MTDSEALAVQAYRDRHGLGEDDDVRAEQNDQGEWWAYEPVPCPS